MESKTTKSMKDPPSSQSWNIKEWKLFLLEAGIREERAHKYSVMLVKENIDESLLLELNKEVLRDVGIKSVGHQMKILKYARQYKATSSSLSNSGTQTTMRQTYRAPLRMTQSLLATPSSSSMDWHRKWSTQGGISGSASEILLLVKQEERVKGEKTSRSPPISKNKVTKPPIKTETKSQVEDKPTAPKSNSVNLLGGGGIWEMLGFQ